MKEKRSENNGIRAEVEKATSVLLKEMGFEPQAKGYHYIRTAIVMSVFKNELMYNITNLLYPAVAEVHVTTVVKVEAGIRHAIERVCDKGETELLSSYFGYNISSRLDKPTNGEFIAKVADELYVKYLV